MSVKGRLVSGFCAGVLPTSWSPMRMAACKQTKIEKIAGRIQEIEETLERENLKRKTPGRRRPTGSLSPLQADPPALDFGQVPVASATRRVVVIANPLISP
jgi:hypothetical protein